MLPVTHRRGGDGVDPVVGGAVEGVLAGFIGHGVDVGARNLHAVDGQVDGGLDGIGAGAGGVGVGVDGGGASLQLGVVVGGGGGAAPDGGHKVAVGRGGSDGDLQGARQWMGDEHRRCSVA